MWGDGLLGGGLTSQIAFLLISGLTAKMLLGTVSASYTSNCSFDLCADHTGPFPALNLISFALPH